MNVVESPAWNVIERMSSWFTPVDTRTPEHLARAQCIAPVAQAVAALSRVSDDLVTDITRQSSQVTDDMGLTALYKVLVYNNYPPGYGLLNVRPPHSEVWGPLEDLGFAAMTLEITPTFVGVRSAVTLVLPGWNRSGHPSMWPMSLLRVTSDGSWSIKSCALYARDSTRGRIGRAFDIIPTMDYFLGIRTPVENPWVESRTGDIRQLGFPGAYEYFQSNLPNLGEYLSGVVAMHEEAVERTK